MSVGSERATPTKVVPTSSPSNRGRMWATLEYSDWSCFIVNTAIQPNYRLFLENRKKFIQCVKTRCSSRYHVSKASQGVLYCLFA